MEFSIAKSVLEPVLATLAKNVAEPKCPVPILTHIHLRATTEGIIGSAFNGVSAMQTTIAADQCEIRQTGDIILPAKAFHERVQAMPEGNLKVDHDSSYRAMLATVAGPRYFTIPGVIGSDWPMDKIHKLAADAPVIECPAVTLHHLLQSVEQIAGTDDSKPALACINLIAANDTLTAVATNGNAIARCVVEHKGATGGGLLIPRRTAKAIRRVLADAMSTAISGTWNVTITMGHYVIGVTMGATSITSATNAETFLDYEMVLKRYGWAHRMIMKRDVLLDAIKAAAFDGDRGTTFTLKKGASVFTITAEDVDSGKSADECAIEKIDRVSWANDDLYFKVDPALLRRALVGFGEDVMLGFGVPMDPVLLAPADDVHDTFADSKLLALVMPMK